VASLSDRIRLHALELGFHKVGIARAEPLAAEGARLFAWLDADYHGEMAWMERWKEKRVDPSELLPNAKSVIAVVLNYYTPHEHADEDTRGNISRYAWGDDYHEVLRRRLNARPPLHRLPKLPRNAVFVEPDLVAALSNRVRRGRLFLLSAFAFATLLIVFSLVRVMWLAVIVSLDSHTMPENSATIIWAYWPASAIPSS